MHLALSYESFNGIAIRVEKTNFSAKVRSFFSFEWLFKWFSKSAVKTDLEIRFKLNEIVAALKTSPSDFEHLTARELTEFGKIVNSMSSIYELYEKADFFDSEVLRLQMEKTLEIAFVLEADLKKVILAGKKREKDSPILLDSIANASQTAIQNKLAGGNEGLSKTNR